MLGVKAPRPALASSPLPPPSPPRAPLHRLSPHLVRLHSPSATSSELYLAVWRGRRELPARLCGRPLLELYARASTLLREGCASSSFPPSLSHPLLSVSPPPFSLSPSPRPFPCPQQRVFWRLGPPPVLHSCARGAARDSGSRRVEAGEVGVGGGGGGGKQGGCFHIYAFAYAGGTADKKPACQQAASVPCVVSR